jgi:RimJ/RimL family protein N-acetyltransferase
MVMLTLIPFAPEHFALLSGWFRTEAEVVQWGGPLARFPLSHDQLQGLLHQGIADPPARLCWMAEKDAALIGHAQLSFDWRNGNAKLCRVGIAPEARGQRLAAPMLRLVIEKAFAFPDIARLELNVYTWNAAAMRAYEGLGFQLEGVRRSSVLVGDERWDTAMMALLRNNLTT